MRSPSASARPRRCRVTSQQGWHGATFFRRHTPGKNPASLVQLLSRQAKTPAFSLSPTLRPRGAASPATVAPWLVACARARLLKYPPPLRVRVAGHDRLVRWCGCANDPCRDQFDIFHGHQKILAGSARRSRCIEYPFTYAAVAFPSLRGCRPVGAIFLDDIDAAARCKV